MKNLNEESHMKSNEESQKKYLSHLSVVYKIYTTDFTYLWYRE